VSALDLIFLWMHLIFCAAFGQSQPDNNIPDALTQWPMLEAFLFLMYRNETEENICFYKLT